ncbi:MAG TPA: hypothetical protein VFV50_07230 [Bdellovibrionales bacterium]|nr:hypothetical protein [Bdellovibrionales bacterium]
MKRPREAHMLSPVVAIGNEGRKPALIAGIAFVAFTAALAPVRPYMAFATFSYGLMVVGLALKRRPSLHVPLMASAIALDLAIVAVLEVQRHAVDTAASFALTPWQQTHIFASTAAVLLYGPAAYLGYRRWRNTASRRQASFHRAFGFAAFVFRTIGFVLMFSLLWRTG